MKGKIRKARASSRRGKVVIQNHHIIYGRDEKEEWKVPIFKGEHNIATLMQRQSRNISKGFIAWLRYWILRNEDKAVDLDEQA